MTELMYKMLAHMFSDLQNVSALLSQPPPSRARVVHPWDPALCPRRLARSKKKTDNPGETLLSLHSARNIDQAVSLLQNSIAQMTC